MKKTGIIAISCYIISLISWVVYFIQDEKAYKETNSYNQKVIVVGKDKIQNSSHPYVFACHPLNSEKFNDFVFHPDFCLYNKVKVGDAIITDIPLIACNYNTTCRDNCMIITIVSAILGVLFSLIFWIQMMMEEM